MCTLRSSVLIVWAARIRIYIYIYTSAQKHNALYVTLSLTILVISYKLRLQPCRAFFCIGKSEFWSNFQGNFKLASFLNQKIEQKKTSCIWPIPYAKQFNLFTQIPGVKFEKRRKKVSVRKNVYFDQSMMTPCNRKLVHFPGQN